MLNLSGLKIRNQLVLLILAALLMMTVTFVLVYSSFHSLTEKRAYIYFEEISNQIKDKIQTDINSIESVAKSLEASYNCQKFLQQTDDEARFAYSFSFIDSLNFSAHSNPNIQSIKLIDAKGRSVNSSGNDYLPLHQTIIRDYGLEYARYSKPGFTRCYLDSNRENAYFAYIYPMHSVLEGQYSEGSVAVLIIYCKLDQIIQSVQGLQKIPGFTIMVSENNFLVASNLQNKNNTNDKALRMGGLLEIGKVDQREVIYKNTRYLKLDSKIDNINWNITCLVKASELTKDMAQFPVLGFTILVITALMLLAIGMVLVNSITVPITQIVRDMKTISDNDSKKRISIKSDNEIGLIAKAINTMLDRIEDITRRIFNAQNALYEAEIERKHAELAFYQSQINPHFLYNTLECIRSIAQVYNVEEIAGISGSMAKIFRYSVKEKSLVSIKSELNCVEDYFNVMSIRYMGKFKMKVFVDESILGHKIPKMTLQPIVENSILHGLAGKREKAFVVIKGYFTGDLGVELKVIDSGKGICAQEVERINTLLSGDSMIQDSQKSNKDASVGLYNINRRIKLNYGQKYGLSVSSKEGFYTVIKIVIPNIC